MQPRAVVIGGSAGAIDALMQLLPAFPADAVVAVLVVVHLPRDQRSVLPEIFQPLCRLSVSEAEDKQPVEPGRIYFAPPDYHLLVDGHLANGHSSPPGAARLSLSADPPVKYSRPAIDLLFETAADVYGPALLGVLLSGGSDDGVDGLVAIRAAGGTTLVQDPAGAQVPFMPNAAIARGCVDRVQPLPRLARLFAGLGAGPASP